MRFEPHIHIKIKRESIYSQSRLCKRLDRCQKKFTWQLAVTHIIRRRKWLVSVNRQPSLSNDLNPSSGGFLYNNPWRSKLASRRLRHRQTIDHVIGPLCDDKAPARVYFPLSEQCEEGLESISFRYSGTPPSLTAISGALCAKSRRFLLTCQHLAKNSTEPIWLFLEILTSLGSTIVSRPAIREYNSMVINLLRICLFERFQMPFPQPNRTLSND